MQCFKMVFWSLVFSLLLPFSALALTEQEVDARVAELSEAVNNYNVQNPQMINDLNEDSIQILIEQGFLRGQPADYKGFQGKNITGSGMISYDGQTDAPMDVPERTASKNIGTRSLGDAAPQSMAAQTPAANEFKTDGDTADLQAAIDRFNRDLCPPNHPITEISQDALQLLLRNELIRRTDLQRFDGLLIREGRVVRRAQVVRPDPEPEPDPQPQRQVRGAGSFMDTFSASAERPTTVDSPVGSGIGNPTTSVRLVERRLTYRDQNGGLVELRFQVPSLPVVPTTKVVGKKYQNVLDLMRTKLLPTKYRQILQKATLASASAVVQQQPKTQAEKGLMEQR